MSQEMLFVILVLYLLATMAYLFRHVLQKAWLSALGLRITILAALVQVVCLAGVLGSARHLYLQGYPFYFQSAALVLAATFIGLCFAKKFYSAGLFFIAAIDLLCVFSFSRHLPAFDQEPLAITFQSMHLASIFLSLPFFLLSLITALMFLLSEQQIRNKHFVGFAAKFPALATLESIHHKALFIGLLLFTFVILSGAGFSMARGLPGFDPHNLKQVLSLVFWFVFVCFLYLKQKRGWWGHRPMLFSLLGFCYLICLFFVGLT